MEVSHESARSHKTRRLIIASVAAVISVISILIVVIPDEKILNSSISITATAGIAMAVAIMVTVKQKMDGLYGKTYVALALGLVCWFAGEVIWTYYSVIAGVLPTELSPADITWLGLYAFFGYYVFRTYRFFGHSIRKRHISIAIFGVAALMTNTVFTMLSSLDYDNYSSVLTAAVRLLYPIGDAVLIVPSVLLLITLRHGLLTYTPWLFISVGLLFIAAADIFFSNISIFGAFELSPIIYPLYNAGNLTFAGGLIWYYMFGIYDRKKVLKNFQEGNR